MYIVHSPSIYISPSIHLFPHSFHFRGEKNREEEGEGEKGKEEEEEEEEKEEWMRAYSD